MGEGEARQRRKAIKRQKKRYDKLSSQIEAFDRAAELVRHLDDAGLAVVPAIGVPDDLIAGSATSADVEEAKPTPDLLQTATAKFGLDRERTIAIGDTVWDIEAARDAGVPIVAFTCGGIAACQLQAAGADEIYAGPADLPDRWSESALSRLR